MTVSSGAALTVAEARAILIADEALATSYSDRLADGKILGIEEREAWAKLVDAANDRVALFRGMSAT